MWLSEYDILSPAKHRRKIEFNKYRRDIVDIIKMYCKNKEVEIIK